MLPRRANPHRFPLPAYREREKDAAPLDEKSSAPAETVTQRRTAEQRQRHGRGIRGWSPRGTFIGCTNQPNELMITKRFRPAFLMTVLAGVSSAMLCVPRKPRAYQAARRAPEPPARDPHTEGYVSAKELPDGAVPPPDVDGNFIIGPTHPRAPEMDSEDASVPHGEIFNLTMKSTDSKIYPALRDSQARSDR